MARDVYIETLGVDQLRRIIRQVKDAGTKQAMRTAHKNVAGIVVDLALPNVPVRSGKLKKSVRALGQQTKANVRAGGGVVPYAGTIHWGRWTGNLNFKHGRFANSQNARGRGAAGRKAAIGGRRFLWDAKNQALSSGALEAAYEKEIREVVRQISAR